MSAHTAIIIPAFNEEAHLQATLQSLRHPAFSGSEVIVVNDGSTDKTGDIAQVWAHRVIHNERNRGKGYALFRGVEKTDADYFLFIDADLGNSACHTAALLQKLRENKGVDLVIASFPPGKQSGFGLVKQAARRSIRQLTGVTLGEPLSGQRGLSRSAVKTIRSWDCGFGIEVAMTIDIVQAGLAVCEIPLPLSHRETGKTLPGFLHRGRQYAAICNVLIQKRIRG
ncbi:glycosyltransferase family 2 protein [Aneurinibacillus terranovensis]|uniref:glycosyltransferase family 2 protein n=1 Tax=Aneurinibacillus terranovensis TaxID=278991 RepID=UPI00041D1611|nr:glycosyltransferase family 2 protein [Aneurinibacillus terranovensis]